MPNATDSGWASTVVVGSITGIALTAEWLPRQVAGHFALDGFATGFVERQSYLMLVIGSAVLMPALVCGLLWLAVLRFPDLVNLPHRDYWLAAQRRDKTAAFLAGRSVWLAAILAVFALALHLLVLRANHLSPARVDPSTLLAVTTMFVITLGAWLGQLRRYFERVEAAAQ
jgi:ABC-type Fe3+ transport system permease subunit